MVLILSPFANSSNIPHKVALAAKRRIPIIPFRAENVDPSEALAYYLSNVHWLDAFSPLSQHLPRLGGTVKSLLSTLAGPQWRPRMPRRSAEPRPGTTPYRRAGPPPGLVSLIGGGLNRGEDLLSGRAELY